MCVCVCVCVCDKYKILIILLIILIKILIEYYASSSATYRWIARFLQNCELPEGAYLSLNASITYELNLTNIFTYCAWPVCGILKKFHLFKSNIGLYANGNSSQKYCSSLTDSHVLWWKIFLNHYSNRLQTLTLHWGISRQRCS